MCGYYKNAVSKKRRTEVQPNYDAFHVFALSFFSSFVLVI